MLHVTSVKLILKTLSTGQKDGWTNVGCVSPSSCFFPATFIFECWGVFDPFMCSVVYPNTCQEIDMCLD